MRAAGKTAPRAASKGCWSTPTPAWRLTRMSTTTDTNSWLANSGALTSAGFPRNAWKPSVCPRSRTLTGKSCGGCSIQRKACPWSGGRCCAPSSAWQRNPLWPRRALTRPQPSCRASEPKVKANLKKRPVLVVLISLGCAKNLVDAEVMLGTLLKDGVEITNDAAQADVVIVNTCSFIDSAQEESVDAILESAALREAKNRGQGLIVSGCLPQRFREELPKLLPEVDAFMGIDQVADVGRIVRETIQHRKTKLATEKSKAREKKPTARRGHSGNQIVSQLAELDNHQSETGLPKSPNAQPITARVEVNPRPQYIPDYATPRFRLTPNHFAYLKIAEGCNHPCSFCIIPRMRGSHRSRQQAALVQEARAMISQGVKELNLISQDSTYYGLDLRPERAGSIAAPDKFIAAAKSLPTG